VGIFLCGFLILGQHCAAQPGGKGQPPPPATVAQPELKLPLAAGQPTTTPLVVVNEAVSFLSVPARFHFQIDPKTPLKDLLPVPPKQQPASGPLLHDDLTAVPEVSFQEPYGADALKQTAHAIAKINHLNRKKTDGFLEALLGERADLSGMPFSMGDSCRMKGTRSQQFQNALTTIRQAMGQRAGLALVLQERLVREEQVLVARMHAMKKAAAPAATPTPGLPTPPKPSPPQPTPPPAPAEPTRIKTAAFAPAPAKVDPEQFWDKYRTACMQEDKANSKCEKSQLEDITLARIAALMQVLGPESVRMRKGLVQYLAGIAHAEATRALAKLAIFSAEEEVRQAAIDALKVRRERDYTSILVQGLRYPWPAVAKRSADALVKLERSDLVPKLVDLLDEPDPRLPALKTVHKKEVPVVRELVRVNHHRNCLMCHAPGTGNLSSQVLTAQVPIPGQPLPTPFEGYGNSQPDVQVRVDVTYLRQDFSLFQPVADAHPWPEMQRFDFLVRERVLTADQARDFRDKLAPQGEGVQSPYHRAVLAALRELTGRDTEPSPEAWRKLLGLNAKEG
jgi:hypothetical protein